MRFFTFLIGLILLMFYLSTNISVETQKREQPRDIKGVWVYFNELDFEDKSKENFTRQINSIFNNIKNTGLNSVFVHVRPFADAIYPSKYYPMSAFVAGVQGGNIDYDPLKIITDTANKYDLDIHAWINPYRISNSSDLNKLSDKNIAKIWLNDSDKGNDLNIIKYDNKLYFNPASKQVRKLITNGVLEIIENYDVDGIHFDDYFYPSTNKSIDKKSYQNYCLNKKSPLPLDDWRRKNVNILIRRIYSSIKAHNNRLIFSISPQANLYYNYNNLYADIEKWSSEDGFIDLIMPQIYFGFDYPGKVSNNQSFKFKDCVDFWKSKIHNKKICVGLGAYRIGQECVANNGVVSSEWIEYNDILSRQVKYLYDNNIKDFCVYSYSSLFSSKEGIEERKNLMKIIKHTR